MITDLFLDSTHITTFRAKERPLDTPAKFSAKMHQVDVAWRIRNSRDIVIGPEPRLILSLRALRDVELLTFRVEYPDFQRQLAHEMVGAQAEAMVVQVPHITGQRILQAEGEPWVAGLEDVDAKKMLSDGQVKATAEQRWYGGLVHALLHNETPYPFDFWGCACKVPIDKDLSVGVIVRANRPTICRVMMAGK